MSVAMLVTFWESFWWNILWTLDCTKQLWARTLSLTYKVEYLWPNTGIWPGTVIGSDLLSSLCRPPTSSPRSKYWSTLAAKKMEDQTVVHASCSRSYIRNKQPDKSTRQMKTLTQIGGIYLGSHFEHWSIPYTNMTPTNTDWCFTTPHPITLAYSTSISC